MTSRGVIRYSEHDVDTASPLAGGCAWIDGEYVPAAQARISVFDAGFAHSDLTYTAVSVWHGGIFRLGEHVERLLAGARKLRIESPLTAEEIETIALRCTALSQLREAFVWIGVTRGLGPTPGDRMSPAMAPKVYAYAIPYLWVFPLEAQLDGASAVVARHVRRSGRGTVDPTVKNLQWGDLTKATLEARERGAMQPILLDSDKCLAEGAGFNVLVVKNGTIATPVRNCLPGITRRTAVEIAARRGVPVEERDVSSEELYAADEVFATTTAGGVTPIVELDGAAVGTGRPGPITTAIRDRFWQLVDEPSALVRKIDY